MRRQALLRTVSLVLVFLLVVSPSLRQIALSDTIAPPPQASSGFSQSQLQDAKIDLEQLAEGNIDVTLPNGQKISHRIPDWKPEDSADYNAKAERANLLYADALKAWQECNREGFANLLSKLEDVGRDVAGIVEANKALEQEMWENVRKLQDLIEKTRKKYADDVAGSEKEEILKGAIGFGIGLFFAAATGGIAGIVIGVGSIAQGAIQKKADQLKSNEEFAKFQKDLERINNTIQEQAGEILRQAAISLLWQKLHESIQKQLQDLRSKTWEHCNEKEDANRVSTGGLCGTAQVSGYGRAGGGLCGTAQVIQRWKETAKSQPRDSATGQPLDGTVLVVPKDEGPPQVNPDDPHLQPGDKIVVKAPCHEKREFVVGQDEIPENLNLQSKDLKYVIDHGNTGAIDQIVSDLAEKGISVDRESIEIKENVIPGYDQVKIKKFTKTEKECPRTQPGDGSACCPDDGSQPPPAGGDDDTTGRIGDDYEEAKERHGQQVNAYPNDPLFHSAGSWGQEYDDQWALKRIGFSDPSLWPEEGEEIIVGVIDTGVDFDHPDLRGSLWRNTDEIPGNGVDDDNNGYVDDVFGWNFVDDNNDVSDNNGHGTVVSGIIAAWTDNYTGIAGVNPWARIMPVKITDFDNAGDSINLARGIRYAVDNGARVINVSVGGRSLTRIENAAVEYARAHNALVVVASGNEGIHAIDYSPAGLPGVVTVASTDLEDRRVSFSNWGPAIDLAAPGVDILSLRAGKTDFLLMEKDDYQQGLAYVGDDGRYYRTAGSSFSAPFVTGAASLILSVNPSLTAEEVRRKLLYSATDIEAPGLDQYTGFGLLNVPAAMKQDPAFSLDPRIKSVTMARNADGGVVINVIGTVHSDRLKAYRLEVGQGENPTKWKKVGKPGTVEVTDDVLTTIPLDAVKGAPLWILRLVAEHENGRTIENRYTLRLQ